MTDAFSDRFWRVVCRHRGAVRLFVAVEATLLVLVALAWWLGPADEGARAILAADAALVGVGFAVGCGFLVGCRRRRDCR